MPEQIPEEVWVFPKIGSKKQRAIYDRASMDHPAKMDTYLTRRLIKTFTRPHDTILDPMCGVGTTLVESVVLGRNTIGVDLESKFTELTQKNLENVEKVFEKGSFKPKFGKAVVITGDSRHLSELLQQHADAILTSPPYANAISKQGGETTVKNVGVSTITARRYSDNPDNIGNLPEGSIDTVLTSPPFSESEHHYKHGIKQLGKNFKGRKAWEGKKRQEMSGENVGNLKHGEISAIITSPPYSEQLQAKADYEKRKERLEKMGHTRKTHGLLRGQKSTSKVIGGDERYSENSENIGNLKHGEVSAIITSPPYSGSTIQDYSTSNKALLAFEKKVRKAFRTKGYFEYKGKKYTEKEWREINKGELKPRGFPELWAKIVKQKKESRYNDENPKNIANLQHGEISAIITSPPYAIDPKNVCHTKEGKTLEDYDKKRGFKTTSHPRTGYSPNKKNIGNLSHESNVDLILTSPPYADIHQCPTNTGLTEFFRKQLEKKGYIEWNGKRYTEAEWRAMNHGRLDGRSTPGVKKDAKYSDNSKNIGNLPLGEINVILTSPPFGTTIPFHDKKFLDKLAMDIEHGKTRGHSHGKSGHERELNADYGENQNNIGNIKEHGKLVDTIITSPPYSEGIGHACHIENLGVRTDEAIQHTQAFKAKAELEKKHMQIKMSKENIGSLNHGEVDAILTSPPFTDRQPRQHTPHLLSKEKDMDNIRKLEHGYSPNPSNIGNLTYEQGLDGTIKRLREHGRTDTKQGGPYGRSLAHPYSPDPNNIGNLKKETYLEAMKKCYSEMYAVLKPQGLCIIVLKNFIRNHKVVDLIGDTVKICEFVGFRLERKIKFRLPTKSFWRILYERKWKQKFGKPLPKEFETVYNYETCLILRKV